MGAKGPVRGQQTDSFKGQVTGNKHLGVCSLMWFVLQLFSCLGESGDRPQDKNGVAVASEHRPVGAGVGPDLVQRSSVLTTGLQ